MANSVPQTAQVKRSEAKFAPASTGSRSSRRSKGRSCTTSSTRRPRSSRRQPAEYFGVQNGVWFVSNSLAGPWLVATKVPAGDLFDPGELTAALRDLRQDLRRDPGSGHRRLHAGLHGRVREQRVRGLRHWLLLPALDRLYWYGPPYTYGFGVNIAYTPWAGWHVGFGYGWSWGVATVAVGWGWGAYPWWGGYGWGGYYPYAYRPGYGAVWGPRGGTRVGTRLLGRHHRQHVSPMGLDDRGDATSRRLQRMDRQPVGDAGGPGVQLAHRRRRRGTARRGRQRVLRQLRDGERAARP